MNCNQQFSANILFLRKYSKLTQIQVAKALNIGVSTLQHWEKQRSVARIKDLKTACKFFKVTADQMLTIDLKEVSNDHN